jgi:hypothetical protein
MLNLFKKKNKDEEYKKSLESDDKDDIENKKTVNDYERKKT